MPLGPGDIVFVGWDADNEDISFVATAFVPAGEVIYFTDDEWDGSSFTSTEQLIEWVVPDGGLRPGDIVTIDKSASSPVGATFSVGGDVDYIRGGGQLATSNEMFWAIQGQVVGDELVPDPGGFISVIGNEAEGGFQQSPDLTNTGLTTSTGAIIIDGDEDYMEFSLDDDAYTDAAGLLAAVGDPGNWTTADGRGNSNPNGVGFNVEFTSFYCFTPGALIDSPGGPRRIEGLRIGDLVTTADNGAQPIRHIYRRHLTARDLAERPRLRPVLIRRGALGPDRPCADMRVSPQHRMLITDPESVLMFGAEEVFATAHSLLNAPAIIVDEDAPTVDYIHLLLDRHEVVFANGAATESLMPSAFAFGGMEDASVSEILEVFPEIAAAKRIPKSARPILRRFEGAALAAELNERREIRT